MQQLLRIESVQAKIKIETSRAQLEMTSKRAQLNMSRSSGGLDIKTEAAKVIISNRGLRESIDSMKPPLTFMKEMTDSGIQAAKQAVAEIVEEGNAMAEPKTKIADIVASRFIQNIETVIDFIPHSGPEISATEPVLEINYKPVITNFDWEISRPQGRYTPYELEIGVLTYPKVEIEYIGEPT
jgi:hypothetical protein